ncbi:DUF58 domain-containing protein [Alteromonas aestuariivivens]|uniref:DUF58 domain-containing protein n=1 Tax=Alteromonas aestuariivivens TaxID=1938339 RepID=A0A3D8MD06_9ALTE|nr:DUF58 domain-containing protein [Alteromonas aestuariivivens]RDV27563.1 DUF58 domain-containing protein [Alteromonas aestuariivivens]
MNTLKTRWQQQSLRWLDDRIPARTKHTLNLRSIFIFPSKFGLSYLLMCGCLFLLGTNYQNNLMLLLCYFLLALLLVCLFKSYLNFACLTLTVDPIQSVFAGNNAVLSIQIQAANVRPGTSGGHDDKFPQGQLHFRWLRQKSMFNCDLNQAERSIRLPYITQRRGVYPLPRVTCISEYPLGLYRCWTHLDFDQRLVVYPAPVPCEMQLESRSQEAGKNATSQPGHDDFYSLRPFVPGEPLNRVAWKNVAKGADWVSKSFSQQQSLGGFLRLNLSSRDIEKELGKLAFQVLQLSDNQVPFGLILGSKCVEPGSGERHKQTCLLALARYGTLESAV